MEVACQIRRHVLPVCAMTEQAVGAMRTSTVKDAAVRYGDAATNVRAGIPTTVAPVGRKMLG